MNNFSLTCNYLLKQINTSKGLVSLSHLGFYIFIYRNQNTYFTYDKLSSLTNLSIKTLHTYIKVLEGLDLVKRLVSKKGVLLDINFCSKYPSKNYYSNLPIFIYTINSIKKENNKDVNLNDNNDKEKFALHEKIINDLNEVSGRAFKLTATDTIKKISWLLSHGYTFDDFKKVHRNKLDWLESSKMSVYYRPKTLYAQENFESYLNEKRVVDKTKATSSKWDDVSKQRTIDKKRRALKKRWN